MLKGIIKKKRSSSPYRTAPYEPEAIVCHGTLPKGHLEGTVSVLNKKDGCDEYETQPLEKPSGRGSRFGIKFGQPTGNPEIANGTYTYAILKDRPNEILCGKIDDIVGHMSVTRGHPVLYAGEMRFENGKMISWSNSSGHYTPPANLFRKNITQELREMLPSRLFEQDPEDRTSLPMHPNNAFTASTSSLASKISSSSAMKTTHSIGKALGKFGGTALRITMDALNDANPPPPLPWYINTPEKAEAFREQQREKQKQQRIAAEMSLAEYYEKELMLYEQSKAMKEADYQRRVEARAESSQLYYAQRDMARQLEIEHNSQRALTMPSSMERGSGVNVYREGNRYAVTSGNDSFHQIDGGNVIASSSGPNAVAIAVGDTYFAAAAGPDAYASVVSNVATARGLDGFTHTGRSSQLDLSQLDRLAETSQERLALPAPRR